MTNAVNIGAVHTQYNLIEGKETGKNAVLFGIYIIDGWIL